MTAQDRATTPLHWPSIWLPAPSHGLEPSTLTEDYEWQRGWLERLVQMYSREAVQAGIELRTILVAANDQHKLWDVFDTSEFDLVVLSRRFSDAGAIDDTSKQLHQRLIGATGATVLLCP
jgi:hypothetical protein